MSVCQSLVKWNGCIERAQYTRGRCLSLSVYLSVTLSLLQDDSICMGSRSFSRIVLFHFISVTNIHVHNLLALLVNQHLPFVQLVAFSCQAAPSNGTQTMVAPCTRLAMPNVIRLRLFLHYSVAHLQQKSVELQIVSSKSNSVGRCPIQPHRAHHSLRVSATTTPQGVVVQSSPVRVGVHLWPVPLLTQHGRNRGPSKSTFCPP